MLHATVDQNYYLNPTTEEMQSEKPRGYRMCVECEVDFATR